ncbi:MAG: malate dehydrogenase (oxaloacetate-decarboxylating) [Chlamydiales bacterium]|jgi:malate dehydrogenase (oxaloacetate-decarboxylating)
MASTATDNLYQESIEMHAKYRGKISIQAKVPINTKADLSLAYTPGVAEPCREIHADKEKAYLYTIKGNLVAVATDGTAVLGLGDIGPEASMPVMEGKAILFKKFADIDAFPICVDSKDPEEFVNIMAKISPTFGGINLEDISAPRCFEIERMLQERVDIPVFHDDQHGTAIVVLAALINAFKLSGKSLKESSIVINGAGAAGVATAKLLQSYGVEDIVICDTKGIIFEGRTENMNPFKVLIASNTNKKGKTGNLAKALEGADVFIGVSVPGVLSKEMIQSMADKRIIFALANPVPEIMPDEALAAGAAVVCTGRSDFPNQVNNVLAFPGIFRGALDIRASCINEEMKMAAAEALADLVSDEDRASDFVIPKTFDNRIVKAVSKAVADAAVRTGVIRK